MTHWIKYLKPVIYSMLCLFWPALFFLTSVPGDSIRHFKLNDKVIHFSAYFILAFLFNSSLRLQKKSAAARKYNVLFTLLILAIYGIFDELHQELIPGREADVKDWIADMMGVAAGITFTASIILFRKIIRFVTGID